MIRLSTALWLALVACVGFGMFEVKYAVMDLEDTLARTKRAIATDQDAIHVLKAEWSYLSQPSRLAELSKRYLELAPIGTAQIGQIDQIPLKPAALAPDAVAGTPPAQTLAGQAARSKPVEAKPAEAKPAAPPSAAPGATRVAAAKMRTEQ